ncbi:DNA replication/repair protein RecF [Crocinitomicaceae bacterium]|nr:DNA replication/repair protein RecF [Crocinitomicaceae bacterium]MDC0099707.1 DNA replication/repair protein RecF [Crocinitomicaceae bacterium]MDC1282921.1 DNA replication/repair protein RecF [Crocinitomicaceae bacterium]|tara:strand:- start:778 stop:1905 length:1128 start_codon:yes stop_codon:yes gene_type:complete
MHLENLHLINFKNYEEAEIQLSDGINCFVGNNGAGKTNILDAVHYLSICKSYMNVIDKQNIRFDQPFFSIQGQWHKDDAKIAIHCAVKVGSKKVFKRNKKEYEKLADHIGQFPAVMISPYDRDLISEGSELRRRWMDGIISQFDRRYLDSIQKYAKVIAQRNALLKNMAEHRMFDRDSIEIWDHQMIELGLDIFEKRKSFLNEFIPVFQKHYDAIGHVDEEVHLVYKSQLSDALFVDLLKQYEKKDAYTRYSNAGVHRDDLVFQIKGHPVKKFGSQGQQKSFIIALRLAQYEWLKNHLNTQPVLLLDDIFDKLDHTRVERLMKLVSDQFFGQVLVTDTDIERVEKIFSESNLECKVFQVEEGDVSELGVKLTLNE